MASTTKRKPKAKTGNKPVTKNKVPKKKASAKAAPRAAARTKARPATKAAPKAAPARRSRPAPAKTSARKRPPARPAKVAKNGHRKEQPERARLSPRVTAALKAATWAADWVAAQGRFVWHDLMTTDPDATRAFYTELFGWDIEELDMGGYQVLLLKNGGRGIGTIVAEPSLPASHWMPYLAVADVDGACQRVGELGGKICVEAANIPRFGRFAVVNDPLGAVFSPLRRPNDAGPPPNPTSPVPGDFCWEELATPDPDAATRFYAGLFGWAIESTPVGQPYWTAKNGGLPVAGIMGTDDRALQPAWLPYIAVDDVDTSADRAATLGGAVLIPPADIPGLGRFAVLSDPSGARFALYEASAAA